MSKEINETIKEFSNTHGAVLLGMHHELKNMQASIDQTQLALQNALDQNAKNNQDVQVNIKLATTEQTRLQAIIKQLDIKITSAAETERFRFEELRKKVDSHIQAQTAELYKYKKVLDTNQLEASKLHETSLALLHEQKKREITHQQKVEQLGRTLNKIGLSILVAFIITIICIWAIK